MAGITRVNGFGQYAQGTVYSVAQLKAFLIDAGGSLAAEDDGAKEAMELLIPRSPTQCTNWNRRFL